jgi:hypothetical protein
VARLDRLDGDGEAGRRAKPRVVRERRVAKGGECVYSYLSAAIGSIRAARRAGR